MADGTGLAFADDIESGARELILRVLDGFDLGEPLSAEVSILAGGASNANYLLTAADGSRRVLRIASRTGERLGYSRWDGVAAHGAAAAAGLAPPIRAVTLPAGHMLTDFVDGPVLDGGSIRSPQMLERIGRTLQAFHGAGEIRGRFSIFDHQRRYTAMSRAEGLNLPPDIDDLNRVAAEIEASLARAQTPERLCHNDLQLPNFIITGSTMVVLDWEWAGMGDPYFDLGATAVNAELDRDEVRRLAAAYFASDDPVHEARVELMMFMSALREATWALVAEPVLELDWDYQAWAREYFGRCRQSVASGRIGAALEVSG
jgi:aminoglycoside phosphotransferase (APT) family kinase protein